MASKPISKGGINLPQLDDIMAAAGIQWLRKARRYPNRLWAKFIYKDMKKLGGLGCVSALRTWREYDNDAIYQFNRYLIKCWEHLKREETMNENTFLGQTIWKNRRFSYRKNKTTIMLHSTYLMSRGYTRVGDFMDKDGKIIEAEGGNLSDFPLHARMEWALAVKHIKKYLDSH